MDLEPNSAFSLLSKFLGLLAFWVGYLVALAAAAAIFIFGFGEFAAEWGPGGTFAMSLFLIVAFSPIAASGVTLALFLLPPVFHGGTPKFARASGVVGLLLAVPLQLVQYFRFAWHLNGLDLCLFLVYPLIAGAAYYALMQLFRRRGWLSPARDGSCADCGYPLAAGESGRCPECGRPPPSN